VYFINYNSLFNDTIINEGDLHMIPEDIINILTDNQDLVANEIDIIDKSITRISDALKTASNIILQKLTTEADSENINEELEKKYLRQSQMIRKYAKGLYEIAIFSSPTEEESGIIEGNFKTEFTKNIPMSQTVYVIANQTCPECRKLLSFKKIIYKTSSNGFIHQSSINGYECKKCKAIFIPDTIKENLANSSLDINTKYYNRISTHEIIVLNTLKSCSKKDHKLESVDATIMTVTPNGSICPETLHVSYCRNCDKYIAILSEYNKLKGIPICEVVDMTKEKNQKKQDNSKYDQTLYDKTGSKLTNHGYNVNITDNLTKEQRQTILGIQLCAGMSKAEILSFIETNIHSGEMRKTSQRNWDNAVSKWKEDMEFVKSFDDKQFIQKIDVDKVILKYTRHRNPK